MAQRPRLSQLKHTDVNYATFKEQYTRLEEDAQHQRKPVKERGELPFANNRDGDQCLVLSESVIYQWDAHIQNWKPILGKGYNVPSGTIKRYRGKYVAAGGETEVMLSHRYDVGMDTLDVYIQGVLQDIGVDYIEIDEVTILFLKPLEKDMQVTYSTPYVVGNISAVSTIEKRLQILEHNNYQLMLTQYYSGKPINAESLVFDGFMNTNLIDYLKTSNNMLYDSIRQSMSSVATSASKFLDAFDTSSYMSPNKKLWHMNSEIMLPLSTLFTQGFKDDFTTSDYINEITSNAFHDITKDLITTDPYYSGGDHYYRGDFISTTGKADKASFTSVTQRVGTVCYGILPFGNDIAIVSNVSMLRLSTFPYTEYGANSLCLYREGNPKLFHTSYNPGYIRDDPDYGSGTFGCIYPTDDGSNYQPRTVYVRASNRIYALYHLNEGSDKYTQKLYYATGRTQSIGAWIQASRPSNMPNTIFGTASTSSTGSLDFIDQVGATYDRLVLRSKNVLYFIDPGTNKCDKVLDFNGMDRIPSNYNYSSRQFTADNRFLYFPARLLRNGNYGYYLEVFSLENGEFIDEILVTTEFGGVPYTTAMGYDHDNERLILGQSGGSYYRMDNKDVNTYHVNTSFTGVIIIDQPSTKYSILESRAFKTNLPEINYRLKATTTLNSGVIEFYIRFNKTAWQRIYPNIDNVWKNPSGAKETTIELRALLKSNLSTSTSPILKEWSLEIRQFEKQGLYETVPQVMTLANATGGKVFANAFIPDETSLRWTVQLDTNNPEMNVSDQGGFTTPSDMGSSSTVLRGYLYTNNTLISPVIQDVELDMFIAGLGVFESMAFDQVDEIKTATAWVTNSTSADYYKAYLSRDDGETWTEGIKEDTLRTQDGKVETRFSFVFKGAEETRDKLKMRFVTSGYTEFYQYGIMINPS